MRASLKKGWLPKSKWLRNGMIAHKAALSKWYRLGEAKGDPRVGNMPAWQRIGPNRTRLEFEDWTMYAAALGRKRGILPLDLTDWYSEIARSADWRGGDPVVRFYRNPDDHGISPAFYKPKGRRKALSLPITITLPNMFIGPPEPAREEIDDRALHQSPEDAVRPA